MSQFHLSRRALLRGIATGLAAVPALHLGTASAQAPAKLAESDPAAKALGYIEDAAKVDPAKEAAYKKGTRCDGCALYMSAQAKDGYGPCAAFPGKTVAAKGWCRAFAAKPAG